MEAGVEAGAEAGQGVAGVEAGRGEARRRLQGAEPEGAGPEGAEAWTEEAGPQCVGIMVGVSRSGSLSGPWEHHLAYDPAVDEWCSHTSTPTCTCART